MVLDTNVLASALFWSGAEATVVELIEAGIAEGYASPAIIDELTRVLKYPRFGLTDAEVEDARNYYVTVLAVVKPELSLHVVEEDPEDNRVLECALQAHADFIVTGAKHLLKIREYGVVRIVRVSEFLEALKPNSLS